MAQRLDEVAHLLGGVGVDLATFTRLEIGGERLAAFLDQARDILGKLLDIDSAHRQRIFGRLVVHGRHAYRRPLTRPPIHALDILVG